MKLPDANTLALGLRSSESITGTEKAIRQLTLPDLIATFFSHSCMEIPPPALRG